MTMPADREPCAQAQAGRFQDLPRHEREDLRQDLLTDLLCRLKHFDPCRGSLGAFAGICFAHHATRLIKRILRGRIAAPVSLDAPLPGDDGLTFADILAEADGLGTLIGQTADAVAVLESRLDLDRALASLPVEQRRHCAALVDEDGSHSELNEAVASRSSGFRRRREIKLSLLARGISAAA